MKNLKNLCCEQGMTLSELAKIIGIRPLSLSRIKFTNNTSNETLGKKIAEALNVPLSDLYIEEENQRNSIHVLSDRSKWTVAKIIKIIVPTTFGEQHLGNLIYRRNLSTTYEIISNDYSKQESYPNDLLDQLILDAIKFSYPQTRVENKLIFCNTDIKDLNALENRSSEPIEIQISPKIYIFQAHNLNGKEFRFHLNLYLYLHHFNIKDITTLFKSSYDIDKEAEIDRLYSTFTPN